MNNEINKIIVENFLFLLSRYNEKNKEYLYDFILKNKSTLNNLYSVSLNDDFQLTISTNLKDIINIFNEHSLPIFTDVNNNILSYLKKHHIRHPIIDENKSKTIIELIDCLSVEPRLITAEYYTHSKNQKKPLFFDIKNGLNLLLQYSNNNETYYNYLIKKHYNHLLDHFPTAINTTEAPHKIWQNISLKEILERNPNVFKNFSFDEILHTLRHYEEKGLKNFITKDKNFTTFFILNNLTKGLFDKIKLKEHELLGMNLLEQSSKIFQINIFSKFLEETIQIKNYLNLLSTDFESINTIEIINDGEGKVIDIYKLKMFLNLKSIINDNFENDLIDFQPFEKEVRKIILSCIQEHNTVYKPGRGVLFSITRISDRINNINKFLSFIFKSSDSLNLFQSDLKSTIGENHIKRVEELYLDSQIAKTKQKNSIKI